MDIWIIWATEGSDLENVWLVDAWDDDSIMGNRSGWDEAVAKAHKDHGGQNVRITRTSIDFDAVRDSFMPRVVESRA